MSVANDQPRQIAPTHPGAMLREDFMPDYDLTVSSLAAALGVARQSINELLRERRAVSPVMALRLARLFGNLPQFWLQPQHALDIWESERQNHAALDRIRPLQPISREQDSETSCVKGMNLI